MSEPTFTRKVYICSRQAAPTSRSTSDFDLTLSRNLVLPQKCAGFITDIQIPHSWYVIDEGQRYLYFKIIAGTTLYGKVELSQGNYTGEELGAAIKTLMTSYLSTTAGAPLGQQFYMQYVASKHILEYALAPQHSFAGVWTDSAGRSRHGQV